MVVISNRRLGPSAELILSDEVAAQILRETSAAAAPFAHARWEQELVRWLEMHAASVASLDVDDIAWTPDHFETQRRFLVEAIGRAAASSASSAALQRWRRMVEAHPREAVPIGRRWQWQAARRPAEGGPEAGDLLDRLAAR
jgi:hypothetical protein